MVVTSRSARSFHVATVCAVGLIIGAPFYWLATSALKSAAEVVAFPPTWIPRELHFENAWAALELLGGHVFLNSVLFTIAVTVLQLVLVICGGFALAKIAFPGRNAVFRVYIATMLVPFHVMLIPTFLVVRQLDLVDTFGGLVIPIVAQTAFGTFLYRQFFKSLPDELLEAARIDGASWGQIFVKIVLPLAGPPTAAYLTVTSLNAWNMYVWPLVAATSSDMQVLPLALAALGGEYSLVPPNVGMMAVLISTLPILVVFIFTQRWFVSGLSGALKE